MLLPFFTALRDARVPVSMKDWLDRLEVIDADVLGNGAGPTETAGD